MSDVWLLGALALLAGMVPLGVVAARASAIDGLVALQTAGTTAALVLLLLAAGFARQPFADLALAMAAMSFAGTLAFAYFMEHR